jgi:hypothetical protein
MEVTSFRKSAGEVGKLCREAGGRKLAAKLIVEHAAMGKMLDLT